MYLIHLLSFKSPFSESQNDGRGSQLGNSDSYQHPTTSYNLQNLFEALQYPLTTLSQSHSLNP
jgi:hypothetical protein